MSARVVITSAIWCIVALGSAHAAEPEYKIQYYVPQQGYAEQRQAQQQPQYISAPQQQTYQVQQQSASPEYERPTHRVAQLLLPSAADRQVAKVAQQTAGPEYAQHIQLVQQQGLANEAIATAQRRAQAVYQRAQQQAQQQQQQQQQSQHVPHQAAAGQRQQYLAEVTAKPQYVQYVPQHQPQQYQLQYEQPEQYQQPSRNPPRQQYRLRQQEKKEEEPEEEHDNDSTYQFGFDVKDDLYTNYQNRKEQRENGKITGSYSVVDSDGFIRTVTYTADPKEGFKAEVVRKPTDIVVKIPKPKEAVEPTSHHRGQIQQYVQQQQEEEQYEQQPQQYQKYRLGGHQQASGGQKQQIVYQYQ